MSLLIGELLADAADVCPRSVAATLGEDSLTYAELDEDANRAANAFIGLGVRRGDVVGWWSDAGLASIGGFAGAARAGAAFASLNPDLSEAEASAILEYLHPALVVADQGLLDGAVPPASLTEDASSRRPDVGPLDERAAHVVYLTSGTTGRPKGVEVSHRASWLRSFPGGSTFSLGLCGDGGILAAFPLYHYGGWHYVLEAWHHRTAFHACRRFDGDTLVATAARRRPAAMYCIPAVWARVLDASSAGAELASVRHADTGTSAAPPDLLARIGERLPQASTSVLYGSTEGGHHTTLAPWDAARKPGSVGRAAPPGLISLSEEGEVLYRGPTLMNGYFERPEETATAMEGGWYHTGDLGHLDEDGYLTITGRVREVIRTGGETVAPVEVEAALAGFPGLADVAVLGVPDGTWGERVCAAVVPARGGAAAPTVEALRAHLRDLAPFKHPRAVVRVDSIPRTAATGQVQRALLHEQIRVALESRNRVPDTQRARPGGGWDS